MHATGCYPRISNDRLGRIAEVLTRPRSLLPDDDVHLAKGLITAVDEGLTPEEATDAVLAPYLEMGMTQQVETGRPIMIDFAQWLWDSAAKDA